MFKNNKSKNKNKVIQKDHNKEKQSFSDVKWVNDDQINSMIKVLIDEDNVVVPHYIGSCNEFNIPEYLILKGTPDVIAVESGDIDMIICAQFNVGSEKIEGVILYIDKNTKKVITSYNGREHWSNKDSEEMFSKYIKDYNKKNMNTSDSVKISDFNMEVPSNKVVSEDINIAPSIEIDYNSKIENLESNLNRLQEKHSKLKEKHKGLMGAAAELEDENNELKPKVEKLEKEREAIKSNVESLKEENGSLVFNIVELEKAVEFYQKCKTMSENTIEEFESDAEWNHSIVDKFKENNNQLKEVIALQQQSVSEANIDLSKLKKKHSRLKKKYKSLIVESERFNDSVDSPAINIAKGHIVEVNLCNHTFKRGSRKGSKCSIKVSINKEFCARHDKTRTPSNHEVKNQCTKTTKRGDRCRRTCMFSLVEGCNDRLDCCYSHRNSGSVTPLSWEGTSQPVVVAKLQQSTTFMEASLTDVTDVKLELKACVGRYPANKLLEQSSNIEVPLRICAKDGCKRKVFCHFDKCASHVTKEQYEKGKQITIERQRLEMNQHSHIEGI